MKSEIQIELENENDELHEKLAKWKSWANAYETRAYAAEDQVMTLKAEIEELRRTHAGGQTGAECAQLQAENNSLRLQLGQAQNERFHEFLNFKPKIEDLKTKLAEAMAEKQQILNKIKAAASEASDSMHDPWKHHKELTHEAIASSMESIAFTNLAGEAARTAKTEEEHKKAWLLRQNALYLHVLHGIYGTLASKMWRVIEEHGPKEGEA